MAAVIIQADWYVHLWFSSCSKVCTNLTSLLNVQKGMSTARKESQLTVKHIFSCSYFSDRNTFTHSFPCHCQQLILEIALQLNVLDCYGLN